MSTAGGQVPDPARLTVVQNGHHPAIRAAGRALGGLDQQLKFTAVVRRREHHETGQTQRHCPLRRLPGHARA
ncbi:MAG: hypothetical protein H0X18_14690 [Geodermatophilaceae bacterium]|nr:hypothetical protein [Geodermatophilaceae bacterium]